MRGTVDMDRGKGTFNSYSLLTFEDGSTTIVKTKGHSKYHLARSYPFPKARENISKGAVVFKASRVRCPSWQNKPSLTAENTKPTRKVRSLPPIRCPKSKGTELSLKIHNSLILSNERSGS